MRCIEGYADYTKGWVGCTEGCLGTFDDPGWTFELEDAGDYIKVPNWITQSLWFAHALHVPSFIITALEPKHGSASHLELS